MKITVEFESLEEFTRFMCEPAPRKTPVEESGLSLRTKNCLRAGRIAFVEDARLMSDAELLKLPNFGRKGLREVREWRPMQAEPAQDHGADAGA